MRTMLYLGNTYPRGKNTWRRRESKGHDERKKKRRDPRPRSIKRLPVLIWAEISQGAPIFSSTLADLTKAVFGVITEAGNGLGHALKGRFSGFAIRASAVEERGQKTFVSGSSPGPEPVASSQSPSFSPCPSSHT